MDRITDIDRRVLYSLLFIACIIPLLRPIGLPVSVTEQTLIIYNNIEELKTGDVAWITIHWGAAQSAELYPAWKNVVEHILTKPGVKLIIDTFYDTGTMMWESYFPTVNVPENKVYGVDYVFLGYYPGGETAIASMSTNIRGLVNVDYYGTPIDELPVMEGINSASDVELKIVTSSGSSNVEAFLRQWVQKAGQPIVVIPTSMLVPGFMPYFPEQFLAIIGGSRLAAEYETILGISGIGKSVLEAVSMMCILLFFFAILGNVVEMAKKSSERKRSEMNHGY